MWEGMMLLSWSVLLTGILPLLSRVTTQDLARKAGLLSTPDRVERSRDYYDQALPSLLVEGADRLNWRVDAIIVDEGQDFDEVWDLSLHYLLHDPEEGIMYVFFDDNQNLDAISILLKIGSTPYFHGSWCATGA
jgi:hypothetical protein